MIAWFTKRTRRVRPAYRARRRPQPVPVRVCKPRRMDNRASQALEVSRTRLLITGAMMVFAFGAIALRLVDVSLMQEAREPRVARATRVQPMRMDRADIVDRNGVLLATNLATASLFANPRKILDADEAARQLVTALPELREAEVARKLKTRRSFV